MLNKMNYNIYYEHKKAILPLSNSNYVPEYRIIRKIIEQPLSISRVNTIVHVLYYT